MPVFRNVNPKRQSGRLGSQIPVIYDDGDGWPTKVNTSSSCPRESHSRRREPGYIPRPRNAFIIFRSSYISGRTSAGEGQQNELSKQAGKVWNKMTDDEKRPFVDDAIAEKKWHQAMYPNYTYCPGRGAAKRKGKTVTKNTKNSSGPTRRMSVTSSSASSATESTFPVPFSVPPQRPPREAAQRAPEKFLQPPSISSSPCPMSPTTPAESLLLENMELSYPEPDAPIKKEDPEPQFDLAMRPPHLDRIPEQFGFKYHSDSAAMLAYLPPMPNINDDITYTGYVPSLFSQFSPLPANPPANSPVVHMTDDNPPVNPPAVHMTADNPLFFSPDGTQDWSQFMTHYSDTPRMNVPGFAWSTYHQNVHYNYAPILSEEMLPEKDMTFMDSVFNFEVI